MGEDMDRSVPEFYADHCMILDNGVTAQCLYKVTPPLLGPSVPEPVVLVRTPLSLLKLHAFLMRRHVLASEGNRGESIVVSRDALVAHQIALEDWTLFWAVDRLT
mgnify:FL=1